MADESRAVVPRKPRKSEKPVRYTDGVDTWESLPGQPNGAFHIPGHPEELFSFKSLHEMIRKNCRRVTLAADAKVVPAGEPTIEDALSIAGDLAVSAPSEKPAPRKGTKASQNRETIVSWFKTNHAQGTTATKRQISDGTKLPLPTISALIVNMPELEVAGKEGNSNLYKLRAT